MVLGGGYTQRVLQEVATLEYLTRQRGAREQALHGSVMPVRTAIAVDAPALLSLTKLAPLTVAPAWAGRPVTDAADGEPVPGANGASYE